MWAWHFKANTLARASTHEATEKTQVFLDRCRCRTLASILYEYEGWGTLISKACIHFECLHVRFNPFFMSPFFKSPLLRAFLSRNVSTIGFARFRSISCKRNSDQQTKDCVFSAKCIRVNKAIQGITIHDCWQLLTLQPRCRFMYSSRTVGVGYLHRRLSNTMSTCTIWVCTRLSHYHNA